MDTTTLAITAAIQACVALKNRISPVFTSNFSREKLA